MPHINPVPPCTGCVLSVPLNLFRARRREYSFPPRSGKRQFLGCRNGSIRLENFRPISRAIRRGHHGIHGTHGKKIEEKQESKEREAEGAQDQGRRRQNRQGFHSAVLRFCLALLSCSSVFFPCVPCTPW